MLIEEILIAPFKIQESQLLMIERRLPYFEASSHLMKEIQSVRVIIRGVYFVPKLYNCPKVRQAHDENFYNCPQFALCTQ